MNANSDINTQECLFNEREAHEILSTINHFHTEYFDSTEHDLYISQLTTKLEMSLKAAVQLKSRTRISQILQTFELLLSKSTEISTFFSTDTQISLFLLFEPLLTSKLLTLVWSLIQANKFTENSKPYTRIIFLLSIGCNESHYFIANSLENIERFLFTSDLYKFFESNGSEELINESLYSQLIALSVYLLISNSESDELRVFLKSKPGSWLLTALYWLYKYPLRLDCLKYANFMTCALGRYLANNDTITTKEFLGFYDQLLSWNGIIVLTLNTLANSQSESFSVPTYAIEHSLDLLENLTEDINKCNSDFIPTIIPYLTDIIKNHNYYPPIVLYKSVSALLQMVPYSISTFRERQGLFLCIRLIIHKVSNCDSTPEWEIIEKTISALLKILTITVNKSDHFHTISSINFRIILENDFLHYISLMFIKKKFALYEDIINLLISMFAEHPMCVAEVISNGVVVSLIDSLEFFVPNNPNFIERVLKILCAVSYNAEGSRIIENFSVVTRIVEALGNSKKNELTYNVAASIGENLQELASQVANAVENVIQGCICLGLNLKNSILDSPRLFFQQINNFGKLFDLIFAFNPEIVIGYLNRGCFDDILDIIQLPVTPEGVVNGFYSLGSILKLLPLNLASNILYKLLQSLGVLLSKIEDNAGSFLAIQDFSHSDQFYNPQLYQIFISIDAHLELIRIISLQSIVVTAQYQDFTECLTRLGQLLKFTMAEYFQKIGYSCMETGVNENLRKTRAQAVEAFESNNEDLLLNLISNIMKLFKVFASISTQKNKNNFPESSASYIIKHMGAALSQILPSNSPPSPCFTLNYYNSTSVSFVLQVLFTRNSFSISLLFSIYSSWGIENLFKFITDLKSLTNQPHSSLWSHCGKFLENIVTFTTSNSNKEYMILLALGCNDPTTFLKNLKIEIFLFLHQLELPASTSSNFLYSEIEIIKHFVTNQQDFFIENTERNSHYYSHKSKSRNGGICRSLIEYNGIYVTVEEVVKRLVVVCEDYQQGCERVGEVVRIMSGGCDVIYEEIVGVAIRQCEKRLGERDLGRAAGLLRLMFELQKMAYETKASIQEEMCGVVRKILERREFIENSGIVEYSLKILNGACQFGKFREETLQLSVNALKSYYRFESPALLMIFLISLTGLSRLPAIAQQLQDLNVLEQILLIKCEFGLSVEHKGALFNLVQNIQNSQRFLELYFDHRILKYLSKKQESIESFVNFFKNDAKLSRNLFIERVIALCNIIDKKVTSNGKGYNKNKLLETSGIVCSSVLKRIYDGTEDEGYCYKVDDLFKILIELIRKYPLVIIGAHQFFQGIKPEFIEKIASKRYQLEIKSHQTVYRYNSEVISNAVYWDWIKLLSNFLISYIEAEKIEGLYPTSMVCIDDIVQIFQFYEETCEASRINTLIVATQILITLLKDSIFLHLIPHFTSKFPVLFSSIAKILNNLELTALHYSLVANTLIVLLEIITRPSSLTQSPSTELDMNPEEINEEHSVISSSEDSEINEYYQSSENQESESESFQESVEEESISYDSNISSRQKSGDAIYIASQKPLEILNINPELSTRDFIQSVLFELYEHFHSLPKTKDVTPNLTQPLTEDLEEIYSLRISKEHLPESAETFKMQLAKVINANDILEIIILSYYSRDGIDSNLLALLLLNLSESRFYLIRTLDSLCSLLLNCNLNSTCSGVTIKYQLLSLRVLETLTHMVALKAQVSIQLLEQPSQQLSLTSALNPTLLSGFNILLSLYNFSLYQNSTIHLNTLTTLLTNAIIKLGIKIPPINLSILQSITCYFTKKHSTDTSLKLLHEMIENLSKLSNNRTGILKSLNQSLYAVAKAFDFSYSGHEGNKGLQILKLCRLIKSIGGKFENIDFLWVNLTETLSSSYLKIESNETLKLLPIIESFFICHYNRSNSAVFQIFSLKNHKVINSLIRQNPSLLFNTFRSLILRFPSLLDFENKRSHFRSEMREVQRDSCDEIIRLHVRRQEVFMDSYHQLKDRAASEMYGKFRIQFVGEEGLDAGGLTREWYGLLARAMFNPNYALFIPSANGVSFQPNSMSSINTEHIHFFKFVGRIIGKALCDGYPLDLYFTRSFYKHICGQQVNYEDMEDLDVDFYKSLKSLMDINLNESELHEYYFAYEEEEFGRHKIKELVPEGRTKRVTEENKMDYIKLLCHMKMTKNIQAQINAFKAGFAELVPPDLISIFDSKELELLISGLPEVDLQDLKDNTDYHNYTKDSEVIIWLWEVLYEFSHEERAEFLQFVTGSSKVPLEGFKALPGLGGLQKFQIHKSFTSPDRLPTAHTCMNQLDLPEYPTKEQLKSRLKLAISEGKEGFGFV